MWSSICTAQRHTPEPFLPPLPLVSTCAGVAQCGELACSTIVFRNAYTSFWFLFWLHSGIHWGSFFISSILLFYIPFPTLSFLPSFLRTPYFIHPSIIIPLSKLALTRIVYSFLHTDTLAPVLPAHSLAAPKKKTRQRVPSFPL
jgi:hypothetical protein